MSDVIHRGRSDHHQRADDQRTVHVRYGEPEIGLQTAVRLFVKLARPPILRGQMRAPSEWNSILPAPARATRCPVPGWRSIGVRIRLRKEIDRADQKRHNGEREQASVANRAAT